MSFSFALTPALPHSGFSCTPCFLLPFLVTGEILFNASWAAHPAGTESLSLFVLKKSFFFFYFWNIFLLGIKFWLKVFFPSFGTLPVTVACLGDVLPVPPSVAAGVLLRPLRKCPRHHSFDVSCGFDYCALDSEFLIFILLGAL